MKGIDEKAVVKIRSKMKQKTQVGRLLIKIFVYENQGFDNSRYLFQKNL